MTPTSILEATPGERKERPILFSSSMMRALLDGTKTMTRRVVKPQPAYPDAFDGLGREWNQSRGGFDIYHHGAVLPANFWRCPYGKVGDVLWCRETFGVVDCPGSFGPHWLYAEELAEYRASSMDEYERGESWAHKQSDKFWRSRSCGLRFGSVPSIHMPRWASRLSLEITEMRVERLQDISEEDAQREGVKASDVVELNDGSPCYTAPFQELWRRIHGIDNPNAWESNCWVWVIGLRRLP